MMKGKRSRKVRDQMVKSGEMVEARPGESLRVTRNGATVLRFNNAYWNDGYQDGKRGLSHSPPDWAGSQKEQDYDDGFKAGVEDRFVETGW